MPFIALENIPYFILFPEILGIKKTILFSELNDFKELLSI